MKSVVLVLLWIVGLAFVLLVGGVFVGSWLAGEWLGEVCVAWC